MSTRNTSGLSANMRHKNLNLKDNNSTSARSTAAMRSNKGAAMKGTDRADAVQEMNSRADTNRGFTTAPGLATAQSRTSANAHVNEHASVHAGNRATGESANASEHMNTKAQTNAGFTTAPGVAKAAAHTDALVNGGTASSASAHTASSKKHAPESDNDKGKTEPGKN